MHATCIDTNPTDPIPTSLLTRVRPLMDLMYAHLSDLAGVVPPLRSLPLMLQNTENASIPVQDPVEAVVSTVASAAHGSGGAVERKGTALLRVVFAKEVAFSLIESIYKAAKQTSKQQQVECDVFIASEKSSIVIIVKVSKPSTESSQKGKKRGIDQVDSSGNGESKAEAKQESTANTAIDDNVLDMILQLKKSHMCKDTTVMETAESALRAMGRLRGASGERALQSFAAAFKKLQTQTHELLVAVSFNAGVCVRVSQLRASLGSLWKDGQFAIGALEGFADMIPPLSEEGKTSKRFGNHPLLLLTSARP